MAGLPSGFRLLSSWLDASARRALIAEVMAAAERAPFYRPMTPGGPMSVEMTSFGTLGWTSDRAGYRYQKHHPVTGAPWPPMPAMLASVWRELGDARTPADSCLVNLYRPGARMGAHRDRDEADVRFPVVSLSLGADAIFRMGGRSRRDPSRALRLSSGDVCVLAGEARLAFHGIERILDEGETDLVAGGGRINLTLRRAAPA